MKRYYYNVGEFTPESECKLALHQYHNDSVFIDTIFHTYKLHPRYSAKERDENGIDYTGFLDHELFNWESSKLEWLNHTILLYNRMREDWDARKEKYQKNDLLEFEEALQWLNNKQEEYLNKSESIDNSPNRNKFEKIKWNGSPTQFGYLFLELKYKGFIDFPKTRGVDSHKKFAKICYEVFEIKGTLGTLEKALTKKGNKLTPANKDAFKIPDIKSLS